MESTGPVLWGTAALQQRILKARLPILMARMRQCRTLEEMVDEVRDIIIPDTFEELSQIELSRIVEIQRDAVRVRLKDDSIALLKFEDGYLLQRLAYLDRNCKSREWDDLRLPQTDSGWILMPGVTLWREGEEVVIECLDPALYDKLQGKLKSWDSALSPQSNIDQLFNVKDPVECEICCQILWEGEPAEFICQNQQCDRRLYHVACIRQWLMTDPTTQVSFGRRFGKCPCCGDRIEVI